VPEITERIDALNRQLKTLVCERAALQYRWSRAATDANTWPDMRRARELLVSVQPTDKDLRGRQR
jgi:hypothetical protein